MSYRAVYPQGIAAMLQCPVLESSAGQVGEAPSDLSLSVYEPDGVTQIGSTVVPTFDSGERVLHYEWTLDADDFSIRQGYIARWSYTLDGSDHGQKPRETQQLFDVVKETAGPMYTGADLLREHPAVAQSRFGDTAATRWAICYQAWETVQARVFERFAGRHAAANSTALKEPAGYLALALYYRRTGEQDMEQVYFERFQARLRAVFDTMAVDRDGDGVPESQRGTVRDAGRFVV